jgi:hypothetical protein
MEETIKGQLTIHKVGSDIRQAKWMAEQEYDAWFEKLHPYITRVEIVIIREMYADRGHVGYLIRVFVEAPASVVDAMHKAAGVEVKL